MLCHTMTCRSTIVFIFSSTDFRMDFLCVWIVLNLGHHVLPPIHTPNLLILFTISASYNATPMNYQENYNLLNCMMDMTGCRWINNKRAEHRHRNNHKWIKSTIKFHSHCPGLAGRMVWNSKTNSNLSKKRKKTRETFVDDNSRWMSTSAR